MGVPWLNSTCGVCGFRSSGRENLCADARFTGYQEDGGYAQYAMVREDFACRLPHGFTDLEAAPLLCAGERGKGQHLASELTGNGVIGDSSTTPHSQPAKMV